MHPVSRTLFFTLTGARRRSSRARGSAIFFRISLSPIRHTSLPRIRALVCVRPLVGVISARQLDGAAKCDTNSHRRSSTRKAYLESYRRYLKKIREPDYVLVIFPLQRRSVRRSTRRTVVVRYARRLSDSPESAADCIFRDERTAPRPRIFGRPGDISRNSIPPLSLPPFLLLPRRKIL